MRLANAIAVRHAGVDVLRVMHGGAQVWPTPVTVFDPEAGLALDESLALGGSMNSNVSGRNAGSVTFACDIRWPSAVGDGVVYERGGSGQGTFCGYRDGGQWFRIRAYNGGGSAPGGTLIATTTSQIDIPRAQMPTDGQVHTLVVTYDDADHSIRMWIDGVLVGDSSAPATGQVGRTMGPSGGKWEGGASGCYLTNSAAVNVGNEPKANWPDLRDASPLRIYYFQTVAR